MSLWDFSQVDGWFGEAVCALCGECQDLRRPFLGCIDIPRAALVQAGVATPEFLSSRAMAKRQDEGGAATERFAFHEDCSSACPEVRTSSDGSRWFNLRKAFLRVARLRCVVCQQVGASLKCKFAACNSVAHLSCAASDS